MSAKKLIYHFLCQFNYYYFSISVFREKKMTVAPVVKVNSTSAEKEFLQLSAASFNYNLDYSANYIQKELVVWYLQNVTYLGNSGALVQQHKVVVESVFDQIRLSISPAYRSPAWMWPRKKTGTFTSIVHLPWAQSSNYHWFYDCLPRLYSLLQIVNEPVQIIINKDLPAYQLETLQFLIRDFPYFSLVTINKNEKWKVDKFLLPSFVTNNSSGYLPPTIADLVRSKIWQGYQVKESDKRARIYISRSQATKRKLLNEDQVIEILQKYDFQIVYAELLSYQEQVNLFYNASCVIGPHGAGLANILFCRKAAILELHPADIIKPHYFLAAKSLNFAYLYLIGSVSNTKMNFLVDSDALEKKVLQLLALV